MDSETKVRREPQLQGKQVLGKASTRCEGRRWWRKKLLQIPEVTQSDAGSVNCYSI